MDGIFLSGNDGSSFIDGVSDNVHNSSQCFGSDGDLDGRSGVSNALSSD